MPTIVFVLSWSLFTREMFKELDKSDSDYIKVISSAFLSNQKYNLYLVLIGVICAFYISLYSLINLSILVTLMIILDIFILILITYQSEESAQDFWSFLYSKMERFALNNRDTFGDLLLAILRKVNNAVAFAEYMFPKKELIQN